MNFIIWSYLEDPIRVGENKNLLKTYTHRCEPPAGRRGNLFLKMYYTLGANLKETKCYEIIQLVDYWRRESYNKLNGSAHSSTRIERLPSKQRVAGSNPAGRAIRFGPIAQSGRAGDS